MKQIFYSVILLLACVFGEAQMTENVADMDREGVTSFVNKALSAVPKNFQQVRIDSTRTEHTIEYWYSDGENFLKLYFSKMLVGANPDLEKPGVLRYRFSQANGSYKDLFAIWKDLFQADADLEKISAAGHGKIVFVDAKAQKERVVFNKYGDGWMIRFLR